MAKRARKRQAGSVNKAQAIRDTFASQGAGARPKDVIATLKDQGIEVSSAQVSNIKATLGKKKKGKAGRKASLHASNGMISLEALIEAKKLAERLGGIDAARHALEVLGNVL